MQIKRQVIDAHHHLWDLDACHYPWLMERGVMRFFGDPTPIQRNYLAQELQHDAADFDLLGSVHVQVGVAPGDELRETEWLSNVADADGLPTAVVAFCDLSAADAAAQLDLQAEFSLVRGVRQIVGRSEDEDAVTGSNSLLDDPLWIRNLGLLRDRNLSFDLQLTPPQVERVAEILRSIPGLRVALCHCGSPWDQSIGGLKRWRAGLQSLAAFPDVFCKISGLSMFNHDWNIEELRSIITACIEIFGPQRCMFGSNFPVDKLHKTYADIWRAYEDIASQYSMTEQAALFQGTAKNFYRID